MDALSDRNSGFVRAASLSSTCCRIILRINIYRMSLLILLVGTHFSQCIASIQHQVGTIKGVEISYCDRDPLAFDLSIRLTQDGIKLVFDSLSQRLKVIEIYDLSLVRLKYWQVFFFIFFFFARFLVSSLLSSGRTTVDPFCTSTTYLYIWFRTGRLYMVGTLPSGAVGTLQVPVVGRYRKQVSCR